MNLNRFQGFLKSLDLSRTKENYEELVKLKQIHVRFFYKQQCIMEYSEQMIFLINSCQTDLEQLNSIQGETITQRYMNIYFNQKLIRSFLSQFEIATQQYKCISNKIDLVLKDALVLLLNSVLTEQEYLLTKSYLTKIKNRFNNQLGQLEESYNDFKCFLDDKFLLNNDINNN